MPEFSICGFLQNRDSIRKLPIVDLKPYRKHIFKLYTGEQLDDMVESIRENGVLSPIIVRFIDGGYEILAGHNRTNAAKLAGLTTIPAIVKENLTDDEAEMYAIETNLIQRGFSDLKPSEQAAAVALEYKSERAFNREKREQIRRELAALGEERYVLRADERINLSPVDTKTDTFTDTGKKYSLSRAAVARLLRINKLPFLFQCSIDDGSLSIRAGVELSYINCGDLARIGGICYDEEGNILHKISFETARMLRDVCTDSVKNADLERVITGNPTAKAEKKSVKISSEIYSKYFDKKMSKDDINDIMEKALIMYFTEHEKQFAGD
jgi:ParB family chromosome partitioning protein